MEGKATVCLCRDEQTMIELCQSFRNVPGCSVGLKPCVRFTVNVRVSALLASYAHHLKSHRPQP
jgi:hypothetical protein